MDSPLPMSACGCCSLSQQPQTTAETEEHTAAPVQTPPPLPAAPLLLPPTKTTSRAPYAATTAEKIFREFTLRRLALILAVTADEKVLFRKCSPRMESLCLYGYTDGSWEVLPPKLFLASGQPEPKMGINLLRNKMRRLAWLEHISRHSDAWLIRISTFLAADLEASECVYETFMESETYHRICHQENIIDQAKDEDEHCDLDPTFCASCGDRYRTNGFWIRCNKCERWSHGKCLKIKPCQGELIYNYECADCCAEKKGYI